MPEDEAWHPGHELSQEHHGQEHGILQDRKNKKKTLIKKGVTCEEEIFKGFVVHPLTSLSIHGLPRHVAKQPNSPKITMVAPVPMRTYGALVLFSEARER